MSREFPLIPDRSLLWWSGPIAVFMNVKICKLCSDLSSFIRLLYPSP